MQMKKEMIYTSFLAKIVGENPKWLIFVLIKKSKKKVFVRNKRRAK